MIKDGVKMGRKFYLGSAGNYIGKQGAQSTVGSWDACKLLADSGLTGHLHGQLIAGLCRSVCWMVE
jgi:hypothetical protein